ncbi:anti-sigma factor domain-containing protein [Microbacterium sp. SS28]|uniref:anti-sigma factor n=1 Tax=Microbacterium sp. SS28 TaxID=2919948 RepID=UPI001FAB12FD|nr:anti-sigma factor [Microbacterium sp. SS28]
MNVHEFAELSAGHALGALSPDDARAFEEALAEHPEWSSIVETDAATASELADGVAEVEPPAFVRDALLARIARPAAADDAPAEPREPAPSTEVIQTVARRNWTRGLLALAASFVLLIALGTTAVVIGDRLRAPASVVALEQIEAAPDAQAATAEVAGGGTATAHWSESVGKVVVVTNGVESATSEQTYELWFVREGTAVSAGQFDTDETGNATALLDGTVQAGDVIAVSVEPEGGSPTGQPTSDPIVTIPTA